MQGMKAKKTTAGRGTCRFCKTRQPLMLQGGNVAPHPIPGNARGASRCSGTGLKPVN